MIGVVCVADGFRASLSKTIRQYEEYIRPIIGQYINGDIQPVEGTTNNKIAEKLDQLAGTDLFCIREDGLTGIASRIQTTTKNWHTFTVRKARQSGAPTEYQKRKHAIENDLFFPKFTYQAYVTKDTGGKLIALGVVQTRDLINYIDRYNPPIKRTGRGQCGQAEFYICDWYDMMAKGIVIRGEETSED